MQLTRTVLWILLRIHLVCWPSCRPRCWQCLLCLGGCLVFRPQMVSGLFLVVCQALDPELCPTEIVGCCAVLKPAVSSPVCADGHAPEGKEEA